MLKKPLLAFFFILFVFQSKGIASTPFPQNSFWKKSKVGLNSSTIIHYWNFNTENYLTPNYSLLNGIINVELGTGSEVLTGSGQGFAGQNVQNGDQVSNHLRINNPLGTKLILTLPTVDHKDIVLRYEVRRSGQGAQLQKISYSLDGLVFQFFSSVEINDADPAISTIDFSEIEGANNNTNFKVLVEFEQGSGGVSGNQRFDNLTVSGVPLSEQNTPPIAVGQFSLEKVIVNDSLNSINLLNFFSDLEGDALTFESSSSKPSKAAVSIIDNKLKVYGIEAGEAIVEVTATDESFNSTKVSFRVIVYPKAIKLSENVFSFSYWDANESENSYPDNMIFLQSDKNDPTIADELNYAYTIPNSDYSVDDLPNVGFPYKNSSRTRINGLGENGISFINTGRGRDVGGALIALDTRGIASAKLKFTAETLITNPRIYNIAVFCRKNIEDNWSPLLSHLGTQIMYAGNSFAEGSEETIEAHLSSNFVNLEYVQVLLKYYYTGVGSGARTQIRLDDIKIEESELPEEGGETPGPSTLLLPADGSSGLSLKPEFTWTAATNSNSYYFQLSESSNFETFIINDLVNATSFISNSVLQNSKQYYWRVKAINSFGEGELSATASFSTVDETETQKLIMKLSENGIPIIEINTEDQVPIVSKDEYVKGNILVYEKSGENLNKLEIGQLEIKGRGNTTWDFPKKPYRLKLGKAKSLLGMPENKHWVLLANFSDKSLLRTNIAFDLSNLLGLPYTPRDKSVEVVLNGVYLGNYQLVEAIKIGPERVNITEIESNAEEVMGGVILEVDVRRGEAYNFDTPKGIVFNVKDPDDLATNNSQEIERRLSYIKELVINAENTLYSENFQDINNGYDKYLNTSTFVNWYLVNEVFKNNDAIFWTSVYLFVDNNKKLSMGPVWDFDISAGNINYNGNENPDGFWVKNSPWISRLFQDTTFEKSVSQRWKEIRGNLISYVDSSITANARTLIKSQKRNFEKWPILGTYVWPNHFIGNSYEEEVEYFKQFLLKRIIWLDAQFAPNEPKIYPPIALEEWHSILEGKTLKDEVKGFHPTTDIKFSIVNMPLNGTISFEENNGEYTYVPNKGYFGTDSFTYVVNNSGGASQKSTITIKVVEDISPTSISLSNFSVSENQPEGTIVGRLSTEGQDGEINYSYSLVLGEGDDDNAIFEISGDTLKVSQILDYEEQSTYSIRVMTKDEGGFWHQQPFNISVSDQDEKFNISEDHEFNLYLDKEGTITISPEQLIEIPHYFNAEKVFLNKVSFNCAEVGRQSLEISYKDIKENIKINLIDTVAPTIKVKDMVVEINENGKVNLTPKDVDDGSFDNCGIQTMLLSKSEFDENDSSKSIVTFTAIDKNGNSSSKNFLVSLDIRLGESSPLSDIVTKVFPNPANDVLTLQLNPARLRDLEEIAIIDLKGSFIRKYQILDAPDGNVKVNLRELPMGLYFLKIRHESGIQLLKFNIIK